VRKARASDDEAIARGPLVTWAPAYRGLLPAAALDDRDALTTVDAWGRAATAPPAPPGHGVLALDGDVVAGHAAPSPAELAPDEESAPGETAVGIDALPVEPRGGRRRHGSRLPAAVVTARGVDDPQVQLPEDDDVTARFLDGAGGAPDGWTRTLDAGTSSIRQLRWHPTLDDEDGQ